MRVSTILVTLALLCAPLTPIVVAQNAHPIEESPLPACHGVLNIVRISEIPATGSMEKFMAAVAAHQAWYKSHGFSDVIVAARLLVRDTGTGKISYSNSEMVTYHYIKPGEPDPKPDAAWHAFVNMYKETSTIKESYLNCVPAEGAPASLK
jgi:hypothetical protein